jgi:hypothetical protein
VLRLVFGPLRLGAASSASRLGVGNRTPGSRTGYRGKKSVPGRMEACVTLIRAQALSQAGESPILTWVARARASLGGCCCSACCAARATAHAPWHSAAPWWTRKSILLHIHAAAAREQRDNNRLGQGLSCPCQPAVTGPHGLHSSKIDMTLTCACKGRREPGSPAVVLKIAIKTTGAAMAFYNDSE